MPDTPATQRDIGNLSASIRDLNTTISGQIDRLANQIQTDRDRADMRYVPRGEWVEGRRADQGLVNDVSKDIAELKANEVAAAASRRQFLFGLALTAITSVAGFLTALAVLLLGKGG